MKSANEDVTAYQSIKYMSYQEWAILEDNRRKDMIDKIKKKEQETLKAKAKKKWLTIKTSTICRL